VFFSCSATCSISKPSGTPYQSNSVYMGLDAWEASNFFSGAARDLCGARGHNQPAHALGGVCLRARRAAPRARGPPRAPGSRYGVFWLPGPEGSAARPPNCRRRRREAPRDVPLQGLNSPVLAPKTSQRRARVWGIDPST
jgi:hypothetical protein